MPHIAPVGDLDRASLSKVTNIVAGTSSFEVGEEEGGWNQPRSVEDGGWIVSRWTTCIFVLVLHSILYLHISSTSEMISIKG